MVKEGDLPQLVLFQGEPVDPSPPAPTAARFEPALEETAKETACSDVVLVPQTEIPGESEKPKPTLRELRAARSLLYNQLLLELVQRRIERAEAIILGYLLTQEATCAQIGPYLVELDGSQHLLAKKVEDDGWCQLYFPELDGASTI